ncbi:fibronectin type-III domain-containing protein 3A-like isoform X4 [Eriocheir sinensis]|uniref:fibronectin type-III domain-containing protein 3A-like isoform X4 n=1 Tax=Eriocheir sinensis TaxID=95602 RepID=UPI0021CA869F|nr:fibronectin type-III domain-containing protein 3A-like isoform X4 [Eriocheir sinensis]
MSERKGQSRRGGAGGGGNEAVVMEVEEEQVLGKRDRGGTVEHTRKLTDKESVARSSPSSSSSSSSSSVSSYSIVTTSSSSSSTTPPLRLSFTDSPLHPTLSSVAPLLSPPPRTRVEDLTTAITSTSSSSSSTNSLSSSSFHSSTTLSSSSATSTNTSTSFTFPSFTPSTFPSSASSPSTTPVAQPPSVSGMEKNATTVISYLSAAAASSVTPNENNSPVTSPPSRGGSEGPPPEAPPPEASSHATKTTKESCSPVLPLTSPSPKEEERRRLSFPSKDKSPTKSSSHNTKGNVGYSLHTTSTTALPSPLLSKEESVVVTSIGEESHDSSVNSPSADVTSKAKLAKEDDRITPPSKEISPEVSVMSTSADGKGEVMMSVKEKRNGPSSPSSLSSLSAAAASFQLKGERGGSQVESSSRKRKSKASRKEKTDHASTTTKNKEENSSTSFTANTQKSDVTQTGRKHVSPPPPPSQPAPTTTHEEHRAETPQGKAKSKAPPSNKENSLSFPVRSPPPPATDGEEKVESKSSVPHKVTREVVVDREGQEARNQDPLALDEAGGGRGGGGGGDVKREPVPFVIKVKQSDGRIVTLRLMGQGQGPPQFYVPPPPGPPPQTYGPPYQPPPPQYPPIMSPPLAQTSPPPPFNQKAERHPRQCDKPTRTSKYYPRQPHPNTKSGSSSIHSTPPLSPKKEPLPKKNVGEEEVQGEDGEDPRNTLQHLLSQVKPPKVVEVTPHKAILQWVAPDLGGHQEELAVTELQYEVFLNDILYDTICTTQLSITTLKPATDYRVFLHCLCGSVRGESSGVTSFQTEPTVPDAPQLPKMGHKSKTSLQFRWTTNHLKDNGSRITAFILELCSGSGEWTEVYRGKNKQHTISKLQPNTRYKVRLAAVNDLGKSDYSPETVAFTSGVVPSQPPAPTLDYASVTYLSLGWSKRPTDDSYTLQMEDSLNGYGFQPVYNGQETRFVCQGLRRNTYYKFRLCAHNDEGSSPFSEVTTYPTLPDRPKPPSPPSVKGRPKSSRLIVTWGPPVDNGGSQITSYRLEFDRGSGFECIYSGEKMEAECTDLSPGKNYRVRVQCKSAGGKSDYSEVSTVTTEAVCPGVCHPPRLLGKPKASQLQLKWIDPEYDGGAPVLEFHIDMTAPDNDRRQVYCGRDHECTVASLLPGRPYIFLVRSVNRIGPGPWSEPLEVVSGAGPPDTPHPPHLACRSPHSVHLVWEEPINNGAGIEQYSVQIAEVSCPHAESSESSSTCGDPESDLTFTSAYTGSATTTEVRNLSPATTYAFKVCCSNSAGVSAWSSPATVTTPAAPPAPVAYISSSPAATTITLLWGEPANHGDPITHYVIEVGDRTVTTTGPETEHTLTDLLPETLYKVRIQAMNSVGPGGFSAIHKVTTRPLPPAPPTLELVKASYNSLKLKWGDGRNLDMLTYSLHMEFTNPHNGNKEFYQVYSGTNQNYKVARLEENTKYHLRICASNEAGTGPFSPIASLSTTKAPPPLIKAPRVTETPEGGHLVEWCSVRCPGEDSIMYRLQMLQAGKDQDYSVVYTGSETSHTLTHLDPHSGYYVRVCGVRVCTNGETMTGAYSSPTLFNTPKPAPVTTVKPAVNASQDVGFQWQRLSDQQKAAVILAMFSLFCAFAAIGLHHFVAPDHGR